MLVAFWLACSHPTPPPLSGEPQPSRESRVWHKAREQYVLGILYLDQGACEEGARAMRTARLFDAENEWLAEEAQRRIDACEAGG